MWEMGHFSHERLNSFSIPPPPSPPPIVQEGEKRKEEGEPRWKRKEKEMPFIRLWKKEEKGGGSYFEEIFYLFSSAVLLGIREKDFLKKEGSV